MVIITIFLSLLLTEPDISVEYPDTVRTGETFTVEVRITGPDMRSVQCDPAYSEGLIFLGSSNVHSFSSVSTPSGQSARSEIILSYTFTTTYSGTHTVGPFQIQVDGSRLNSLPPVSVEASGNTSSTTTGDDDISPQDGALAWIELEIDTTGRVYPGQTFQVDYYLYKTQRNAEIVDLILHPSEYASAQMIENTEELNWSRCKDGVWRTWITTLDITPAFACSLELPVLEGRIGIPGGFARRSTEQRISSAGAVIPVYAFPERGMPWNFSGLTGEVTFTLKTEYGCYSQDGEKCVTIQATGPGAWELTHLPDLTVSGPATLLTGQRRNISDSVFVWQILVEPIDSGRVVIGPDSIAWFDTDTEVYMQAVLPPCTLSVYAPVDPPVTEIEFPEDRSDSILPVILLSAGFISLILILILRRQKGFRSKPGSIAESQDPEELLTSLEYHLSSLLKGTPLYMGSEELDNALEDRDVDTILARRLIRHWKDLEMFLSGREVSTEQMERLKRTSRELVEELRADLRS